MERNSPETSAGLFSVISYGWISSLFTIARTRGLEQDDLFYLPAAERTSALAAKFNAGWQKRIAAEGTRNDAFFANAFKWSIWGIVRRPIIIAGLYRLINTLIQVARPLAIAEVLAYIEDAEERELGEGFGWSVIIFGLGMLQAIVENMFLWLVSRAGWQARSMISSAVFAKSLRLSTASRQSLSQGQIVNLMQLDAEKIERFAHVVHVTWDALLQLVGYCAVIYFYIEESVFVGLAVPVAMIPFQACTIVLLFGYIKRFTLATDERIKLSNEAMISILAIKSSGWEEQFSSRICDVRRKELMYLRKTLFLASFGMAFVISIPTLMAVAALSYFGLTREEGAVSASLLFAAVQAFGSLRFPLLQLPGAISAYVNVKVSQRRLSSFLALDERDAEPRSPPKDADLAIEVSNADFTWSQQDIRPNSFLQAELQAGPSEDKLALRGVSLAVEKGSLVGVIGIVGSGKSTLLSAMLGELELVSGSVRIQGSLAYSSQSAWIQNATLRDNVLFGSQLDRERYAEVLKVTQLERDLDLLEAGDQTEIGERGINLSGGQAQRVSVARAAYSNSDVVLLDDPLSALDPEVGSKVFQECILGFLSDKTRLVVTNELSLLQKCDFVIGMGSQGGEGRILFQGEYNQLLESNEAFAKLLAEIQVQAELPEEKVPNEKQDLEIEREKTREEPQALIQEEERERGSVKWKYYWGYLRAGGLCLGLISIFLLVLAQLATMLNLFALGFWANDPLYEENSLGAYVVLYAGAAGVASFFYFLQAFSFLSAGLNVSKKFHQRLLDSILRAPMAFFDTTPTGRIISRFSRDLNSLDTELPVSLMGFLFLVGFFLVSIIAIIAQLPLFLAVLPFLVIIYAFLMVRYRPMARDTKRLESVSRSPIYQHFGETLGGLSSIRAFSKESAFMSKCEGTIDNNLRASYALKALQRWISIRISLTSSVVIGLATAMVIYFARDGRLNAGTAGVVLTMVFSFTGIVGGLLQGFVNIETLFNSVERLHFYSNDIPREKAFHSPNPPPLSWPSKGEISFTNVVMRYRPNTPVVLKSISFAIPGGSKCGIVGRTGCGKSSILLTLLRVVEAEEGAIEIDGVNVGDLGLHELRQSISLVPQSPLMFSGSVRLNLDPFGKYSDEEVWRALDQVGLSSHIRELPEDLASQVVEYGENFSQGQRQLMCMARSLLANAKILLLDEATSSVDYETDGLIQKVIRTQFPGCTVMTIAHRVQTIADYDNVLVVDDGQVAEFGNPAQLLAEEESQFSRIVAEMGAAAEAALRASLIEK